MNLAPLKRKLTPAELREIRAIWDLVPPITGCKGLCHDSCTNVPINPAEAYFILEQYGGPLPVTVHPAGAPPDHPMAILMPTLGPDYAPCRFLDDNNRCMIYENRPLVCRMFGHPALTLRCIHGCSTENPLTDEMAADLMQRMVAAFEGFHINPGEHMWDAMIRTIGAMEVEIEVQDAEVTA